MIHAFALNSIPFISECMQDIVTKSSLPRRGKRTATASASNNDADINLEEEDDDILGGDGELSDIHRQMNGNGLLRGPSDVNDELFAILSGKDTSICFCVKCRKTFVGQNAITIHAQNAHKDIAREADGPRMLVH